MRLRIYLSALLITSLTYGAMDLRSLGQESDHATQPATSFASPCSYNNGLPTICAAEHPPGLEWDFLYTNEALLNTRGGRNTGGVDQGVLDIVSKMHLSQLGMDAIGGDFILHGQVKHGPSFQPYTGGTQSTNITADPFVAVAEFYWEKKLVDDLVVMRAGRQVGAIQFSVMDAAADFLYGGFQKAPNNPVPWYPTPTIGVTADVTLTEQLRLNVGSFNASNPAQLTKWGWADDGKTYNVAEINYAYELLGQAGDIKNGYWYESGTHQGLRPGTNIHGNYGTYFGIQQFLVEDCSTPKRGLGSFFLYSYAPSDRNLVQNQFATGLIYRGLSTSRSQDVTGIGTSWADFSPAAGPRSTEVTSELFHKFVVCDNAYFQPALQYITSPGGTFDDALAIGLRSVVIY